MKIIWKSYRAYDEAKDCQRAIYLHEWGGRPFYWGMLDKAKFGGNRTKKEAGFLNPRYGSSYKHWIEGCLRHGASLYIGIPQDHGNATINAIEKQLIHSFPSEMNAAENNQNLIIEHHGEVPASIIG